MIQEMIGSSNVFQPGTDVWRRGENVYLLHAETKMYLGASKDAEFNEKTCGRNCPLMLHLLVVECFGWGQKDVLSKIQAEQGIYLHL